LNLSLPVKGYGDEHVYIPVSRKRLGGQSYLPPQTVGQVFISVVFEGMNKFLYFTSLFVMEERGGVYLLKLTCKELGCRIVGLMKKAGIR
jgi:hypothetical protein